MNELRKTERLRPLVIPTEFEYGAVAKQGYITNLSEGGAFLATQSTLPAGQPLSLQVTLPWGLGMLSIEAKVVWLVREDGDAPDTLPGGVGVTFPELSIDAREKIRLYMQKFHQLLAKIEVEGLASALAALARDGAAH